MNRTIMDLSVLSNFELNREVAIALRLPLTSKNAEEYEQIGDALGFYDKSRSIHMLFDDYCDNPESAYQIIFNHKISTYWKGGVDDLWAARTVHTPFVTHENPLRAAMTVFVIMNDLEGKLE